MTSGIKAASHCCGCTACVNICPQNAIKMEKDKKGFAYPHISRDKCKQCSLCDKVCNFPAFKKNSKEQHTAFAARHKSQYELETSRSGGFFSAVADYVIKNGGVCYGAVITDDLRVIHHKAEAKAECLRFKGSKYVQSIIADDLFRDCKKELEKGKQVVFSGTGCQVHGLLSYLELTGTDRRSLIAIDFVCHGVPSPDVWDKYIKELEAHEQKKITAVNFRDKKSYGWSAHKESYFFADGSQKSGSKWADVYYQHCMFRESCYSCPYTTPYRDSDYTIADYWGYNKLLEGFNDDKGLSLVITHNDKALALLDELSDKLDIIKTDLLKSLQPQLIKPPYKGIEYRVFWKKYCANPQRTVKQYFFPGGIRLCCLGCMQAAKKLIKNIMKAVRT